MSCDLNTYECSDKGLILPLVSEYTWSTGARATLYLLGMLWCFMGVSIIADVFMQSIETITSKCHVVRIADPTAVSGQREIHVKAWNSTVANLTLMALGSSAPEILLSVIEIVGNKFQAGELGPGTIVGSAAFNLFCITGVCVMAIPNGETRRIEAIKVFAITAFFSVFAYIWLIIILVLHSEDYVDVGEAVITLLMFPVLVLLAYMADKECCTCSKTTPEMEQNKKHSMGLGKQGRIELKDGHTNEEQVVDLVKKIGSRQDVTEEDEGRIMASLLTRNSRHSKNWYRINAIRRMTGGHKLDPATTPKQVQYVEVLEKSDPAIKHVQLDVVHEHFTNAVIEWAAASAAVLEKDQRVKLMILRHGNIDMRAMVKVETIDGTAESISDYKPFKETLVFQPGQTSLEVTIEIVEDKSFEPDEVFYVRLSVEPEWNCTLGKKPICQVTIVNDDAPGVFSFVQPSYVFKESAGEAVVEVKRTDGCDGTATVKWETRDHRGKAPAAVSGVDYVGGSGELVFKAGELSKSICIQLIDDQAYEKDEYFDVVLTQCSFGAKLGAIQRTVITILNDDDFKGIVSRIVHLTNANLDEIAVTQTSWSQQFHNAMNVNGGDLETASSLDYILHFFTFGWKVFFACVPPCHVGGGWVSFFVSLSMIGLLTAIVGDLASIFGCLIGLKPTVTAITFVALGTSLPDLFASKQAAVQEECADNSIGNVTGSNSVNVFLGLGLPWSIAAIYWGVQGKSFEVPAGSLAFSVILYAVCAVVTIIILMARRTIGPLGKGELGGPTNVKIASAIILIFLWFIYVILSALQAYDIIKVNI